MHHLFNSRSLAVVKRDGTFRWKIWKRANFRFFLRQDEFAVKFSWKFIFQEKNKKGIKKPTWSSNGKRIIIKISGFFQVIFVVGYLLCSFPASKEQEKNNPKMYAKWF